MKEKLYTIPLNDAVNANDECPFCFVWRSLEQDMIDFVLGSCASYMEADMRANTDKEGFCQEHFKKLFDYGNTLGNGWILKTHYMKMREELNKEIKAYKPGKTSLSNKILKKSDGNNLSAWAKKRESECYICNRNQEIYDRYMDTFFILYKQDENFRTKIKNSKGFCITHFGDLCANADIKMNDKERQDFFDMLFPLMTTNMERMQEDINWLVEKFDYENADKDWKNSKDAVQRGMQNLKGGYPADKPYKASK